LTSPKEVKEVTYIWSSDGWCYIPEVKMRQRFLTTNDSESLILIEESWEGVIPLPQNLEKVTRYLLSEQPRCWMEENQYFSEIYVEQTTTQSKNKKSRDHQPE
jgi:hypothetical protein